MPYPDDRPVKDDDPYEREREMLEWRSLEKAEAYFADVKRQQIGTK